MCESDYSPSTSGIPATDVSTLTTPASTAAEHTYFQFTCPIAAAAPIPAMPACAIVLTARTPAAFNHLFVSTLVFNTLFLNISNPPKKSLKLNSQLTPR